MTRWEKIGAVTAGILGIYGVSDATGSVFVPAIHQFIDERIDIKLAGLIEQIDKRLNTVEQVAKETNRDVDALRSEQSILRTKIGNTEKTTERTEDKIDRLLERLLPVPR